MIDSLKVGDIENPGRPFQIPVQNLEFVTVCRPFWDAGKEGREKYRAGEEVEEDLSDEESDIFEEDDEDDPWSDQKRHLILPENRGADDKCMCGRNPDGYPSWKWIISKRGLDVVGHLTKEFWARHQDAHDQFICSDWTGYGFQELIENEVS